MLEETVSTDLCTWPRVLLTTPFLSGASRGGTRSDLKDIAATSMSMRFMIWYRSRELALSGVWCIFEGAWDKLWL